MERIVRFPNSPRQQASWREPDQEVEPPEPSWAAPDQEHETSGDPKPQSRRRRPSAPPDPLPRYAIRAVAFLLAIGMLGYMLMQLIPVGRSPSGGQSGAAPAAQQGGNTAEQSVSPPAARPGEGSIKATSRVIEPSYTVKPGDTLNSIATRHGTTVDALQSINNLPDRNVLSVGQKLVIPNQE